MTQVRNATLQDVNAISCVLASSWKSAYRGIVHDEYLDLLNDNHWVDFLNTGIENQTVFAMILEKEEKIIGAAILSADAKEAHLRALYLAPEKIGGGFGQLFYSGIETELMRKGFTKCVLDVLQDNNRAIRFYEAHGFFDTNKKIHTKLGEYEYTCKVYEKNLASQQHC